MENEKHIFERTQIPWFINWKKGKSINYYVFIEPKSTEQKLKLYTIVSNKFSVQLNSFSPTQAKPNKNDRFDMNKKKNSNKIEFVFVCTLKSFLFLGFSFDFVFIIYLFVYTIFRCNNRYLLAHN